MHTGRRRGWIWLAVSALAGCSSGSDDEGAAGQPAAGAAGVSGASGQAGAAGAGHGGKGPGGHAGTGASGQAGAAGQDGCQLPDDQTCTLAPQCGCGVGAKCDVQTVQGEQLAVCVEGPGDGKGALGCPDSQSDSCAVGYSCSNYGTTAPPYGTACEPWCRVGEAADCPDGVCLPYDKPFVADGVTYGTCRPRCDPLDPTAACGPGGTCVLRGSGDQTYTVCLRAGAGVGVGGCDEDKLFFQCAPGHGCNGPVGSCQPYCRTGQPSDCADGQVCSAFAKAWVLDGVEYGLCRERCDPLDPEKACPKGSNCATFTDPQKVVRTQCSAAGTADGPAACDEGPLCVQGDTCVYYTSKNSLETTCNRICTASHTEVCGAAAVCVLFSGFALDGDQQGACARHCDLVAPAAACGPSGTCVTFKGPDDAQITDCRRNEGKATGQAKGECKEDPYACASGYACVGGDCQRWCKPDDASGCPAGSTCAVPATPVVIGDVTYGHCLSGPI